MSGEIGLNGETRDRARRPTAPREWWCQTRAENAKDAGRTQQNRLNRENQPEQSQKTLEMRESLVVQLEGAPALAQHLDAVPLLDPADLGNSLFFPAYLGFEGGCARLRD